MTPENYSNLATAANIVRLEIAESFPGDAAWLREAQDGALKIAEAMRTPITPGALVDAGWVRDEAWPQGWYSKSLADNQTLDLCINGRLRFVVNVSGDSFWFCGSNMYDLGELVRLLGGAQ